MSENKSLEYIVNNEGDIQDVVKAVLKLVTNGRTNVLAFNGDLGAGKTTFTKVLAKQLGITEPVTSPTFVIQKSYDVNTPYNNSFEKLVHIDAYRLESGEDTEVLNLKDTINNKTNLIVIEWAENIKSALPQNTINMNFEYLNNTTRRVVISGIL